MYAQRFALFPTLAEGREQLHILVLLLQVSEVNLELVLSLGARTMVMLRLVAASGRLGGLVHAHEIVIGVLYHFELVLATRESHEFALGSYVEELLDLISLLERKRRLLGIASFCVQVHGE